MGKGGGDNLVLGICEVHMMYWVCQHFEDSVSSSSPESNFYQHPRFQVKIQKDVVQKQNVMKLLTHNYIFSFQM